MGRKWTSVIFSVFAVLGAFMPIAVGGGVYVYLHHLGGISYLLYLLPIVLLGISVLNIYKDLPHMRTWFVIIGGVGVLLSLAATYSGIQHINAFVATMARFEQESRQFQENFNRSWNEMDRNFKSGGDLVRPPEQKPATPAAGNEVMTPSAIPAVGSILLITGFVVAAATGSFARRKAIIAATAAVLAIALINGPVAIAASKKQTKESKKGQKEDPQPFGLVFGKTSSADALKILGEQGGLVTSSGNRIIKDDLANPEIEGYYLSGVRMEGVREMKIWFFKDTLMGIDYELGGSFKSFNDQLREKYGEPAKAANGFGGEAHAFWKCTNVVMALDKPFIENLTLTYRHLSLYDESKQSDKRYYSKITKEKAKSEKGL